MKFYFFILFSSFSILAGEPILIESKSSIENNYVACISEPVSKKMQEDVLSLPAFFGTKIFDGSLESQKIIAEIKEFEGIDLKKLILPPEKCLKKSEISYALERLPKGDGSNVFHIPCVPVELKSGKKILGSWPVSHNHCMTKLFGQDELGEAVCSAKKIVVNSYTRVEDIYNFGGPIKVLASKRGRGLTYGGVSTEVFDLSKSRQHKKISCGIEIEDDARQISYNQGVTIPYAVSTNKEQ